MKQEYKELLLQDLCARMPYKIMCHIEGEEDPLPLHTCIVDIYAFDFSLGENMDLAFRTVDEIKPYLFPLSSMTENQKEDLLLTIIGNEGLELFSVTKDGIISNDKAEQSFEKFSLHSINFSNKNIEVYIDWLNKNHFDYRGLIEKGLALDATGLNIY